MNILEWAQRYIELGWAVFPLHSIDANGCCTCGRRDCSDAGKHPRVQRGLKEASKSAEQVATWFGPGAPLSNIGLVTGAESGITVLDIDIGDGKLGAETWAELVKEAGEPVTLMARTGSGGLHAVFKYNAAMRTAANVLGPGVDCRNDGGYIVAPPSRHRSGGTYSWLNQEPLADLPRHLTKKKNDKRGRPRKEDALFRQKYSIEQVAKMLEHVDPADRDVWRNIGVILGRQFDRVDEAWTVYTEWAARWDGPKGRNHDEIMHEAFYDLSQQAGRDGAELSLGTLVRLAIEGGWTPQAGEVPIDAFLYYGPGNNYIYRPTITFWAAEAVNAACSPVNEEGKLIRPSDWLKAHALLTSMTKDPAIEGDVLRGQDSREGILVEAVGAAVFNAYRAPTLGEGDPRLAAPFLDHLHRVFPRPGDADQFLKYMAHRVQRPAEKPRFALLIAGDQGIGKDTAVEFCVPALGAWNCSNIEPAALDHAFNEYAAAVLVRVSEAANLIEMSKWAFNEKMKVLIAGSPDYVAINPKYGSKYHVRLHCGVIITTNHMIGGIFVPQDDRRYDIIQAATRAEMGIAEDDARRAYFDELWEWFLEENGAEHVGALLRAVNLEGWSAANGQRKTEAHRAVVQVGMHADEWLADALDELGEPDLVRADWVMAAALKGGLHEKEVSAKMAYAMERCGYVRVPNPKRKDGRHKFADRLAAVYCAKEKLSEDVLVRIASELSVQREKF